MIKYYDPKRVERNLIKSRKDLNISDCGYCIVCNEPLNFFTSVRGKVLMGNALKRIEKYALVDGELIDTSTFMSFPKLKTGRAHEGCKHKLTELLAEE